MSTWRLRSGGSLCPPEHNFCCAGSLCPPEHKLLLRRVPVPCAHFSDNSCCAGSLCPALVSGFPCFTEISAISRPLMFGRVTVPVHRKVGYKRLFLCSDGSPCPFTAKLATNAYSYVRTGHRARSPQSWLQTLIQTIQFPLSRIVLNILPNRFQCRLSADNMIMKF